MPTDVLDRDEATIARRASTPTWDKFFALDDQVVALYDQDTPASTDAADALILGDGYNVYFELIDLTDELRASVDKRAAAATAAADGQQTSADAAS